MVNHDLGLLCDKLRNSAGSPSETAFIGFDGFNDRICKAVDKRISPKEYTSITTIEAFGKRIVSAAGKSTNIEFVEQEIKIGGNAPILANALIEMGSSVVFAGAIGNRQPEQLFAKMASRCARAYFLCESAHTDAIEFSDGKILFGKIGTLAHLTAKHITDTMGSGNLLREVSGAHLTAMVNWTMMPMMTDLWNYLAAQLPPPNLLTKKKYLFIDLADPGKRSDQDIFLALDALKRLSSHFCVVLGLNMAESDRLAELFGLPLGQTSKEALKVRAKDLLEHTGLGQIVIHAVKFACAATQNNLESVDGPYCPHPIITTGAGDHFNAGYCHGLMHNFPVRQSLLCGSLASGYYVRTGVSPSLQQLSEFAKQWPKSLLKNFNAI